jgi:capsule polysaccharide export protein KpsE/RkpR
MPGKNYTENDIKRALDFGKDYLAHTDLFMNDSISILNSSAINPKSKRELAFDFVKNGEDFIRTLREAAEGEYKDFAIVRETLVRAEEYMKELRNAAEPFLKPSGIAVPD